MRKLRSRSARANAPVVRGSSGRPRPTGRARQPGGPSGWARTGRAGLNPVDDGLHVAQHRTAGSSPTYGVDLDLKSERTLTKDLIMKRLGSGRRLIASAGRHHHGIRARRLPTLLALTGVCLVLVATSATAHAAPAERNASAAVGGAVTGFDPTLVAGYLAEPADGLATASLRFKVPTVKCASGEERAVSIGLGDLQDLETPQVRAHVVLTCPGGERAAYTFAAQACSDVGAPRRSTGTRSASRSRSRAGSSPRP